MRIQSRERYWGVGDADNCDEVVLPGIGAGYAASKLMDRVTTAYQEQQSEASKQREKELKDWRRSTAKEQQVPAYVKAAEKLTEIRGEQIEQERAERLGQRLHLGLGLSGGLTAALLAARGVNPLAAGILTGLVMWVLMRCIHSLDVRSSS